ncbi:unnamed protein product [Paramecium sonneborni]|uniref:Uncharacterized protein n=1 Tax=Paramecium sonneborni TaxID=65129 RepID=A0A8S1KL26_9CILI|nr:unnamed protein product [Paramecium sonneborni]
MFNKKKANIKFISDKKFCESIKKNVIENMTDEGFSLKIPEKTQKSEKTTTIKLTTQQSEPILKQITSLIKQQKTSDKKQLPNSAEVTKCYEDNSSLIQQLMQENIKLKKQNLIKDSIINKLITKNDISKVNQQKGSTSQTERQCNKLQHNNQKNACKSMEELSSLGFTFCNTEQKNNNQECEQFSIKSQKSPIKLPKEFQIITKKSQNKFFI